MLCPALEARSITLQEGELKYTFATGLHGQLNISIIRFQQQLGMESQIVAAICKYILVEKLCENAIFLTSGLQDGLLAFSTVALTITVPKMDDKWRQRVGAYVWMTCIIFVFSCLMNLFKLKNGAYPFRLLF